MGQQERQRENARESRRERAKQQRGRRAANSSGVSLRDGDWIAIAALITTFAEAGGAVRIGFTRDGGAFAIGCYLGDDYATEYVRPSEDFRTALLEIGEAWLPENGMAYHQAIMEFEQKGNRR